MLITIVLGLGSALGCLQRSLAALMRRAMPELLTLIIAQASAVLLLPVGVLCAIGSISCFGVELFCSSAASSLLGLLEPVLWIQLGSAVLPSAILLSRRGREARDVR